MLKSAFNYSYTVIIRSKAHLREIDDFFSKTPHAFIYYLSVVLPRYLNTISISPCSVSRLIHIIISEKNKIKKIPRMIIKPGFIAVVFEFSMIIKRTSSWRPRGPLKPTTSLYPWHMLSVIFFFHSIYSRL